MKTAVILAGAAAALAITLTGCSGSPDPAPNAASVTGFTIDDRDPVNLPWHTTGWETSAAVCDPALPEVVEDYRASVSDDHSDDWWEGAVYAATRHCGDKETH